MLLRSIPIAISTVCGKPKSHKPDIIKTSISLEVLVFITLWGIDINKFKLKKRKKHLKTTENQVVVGEIGIL